LIEVAAAPVTLKLINTGTGLSILSSNLPVKASMVIGIIPTGLKNTSMCFSINQLAHIIAQLIVAYPEKVMSVYTSNLNVVSGTPHQLFTAPDGNGPGIFVLINSNGNYEGIPLNVINAIYPGDETVHQPTFTYLPAPSPLPPGCDTDLNLAISSYLPLGTEVIIQTGVTTQASGGIYRLEYGMLILSDEEGNTPVFIVANKIARIVSGVQPPLRGMKKPMIYNEPIE